MADHLWQRSFIRFLIIFCSACALLVSVVPRADRAAGAACVSAVPIGQVSVGMQGSGLTVTRGTTPEPFDAEVLGILNDGIAPGVDMIIAELSAPAIAEAGVWAGMSGSPVYADDGRLIGAVSYSLSAAPSSIAGLTPAAEMLDLYTYPGATQTLRVEQDVSLPSGIRDRAARSTDTTASELRQGMSLLPVPVGVSSLRRTRLDALEERLGGRFDVRLYSGNRAGAAQGDPAAIVPGGNFVAALSYGDVTIAGVGTTTDVCNGAALAFGHPFFFAGRTAFSAHSASAITIQPDALFGAFKLANPGGVVGTVDQDRLAGLRARLGDGPTPSTAWARVRSTSTGRVRAGRTFVNRDRDVPDIAPFHVLSSIDRVLDKIGDGRTQLTWTAEGRRGDGSTWSLRRTNRFADRFDVSFESIFEMLEWLYAISENQTTSVTFDRIRATSSVNESFQQFRVGTVRVAVNGGRYRLIKNVSPLRVRPGDVISVRVDLKRYRQSRAFRTLTLKVTVPQSLSGRTATLGVYGGQSIAGETNPFGATSLDAILGRMRRAESNNDVIARLERGGGSAGPNVVAKDERSPGTVVTGRRSAFVRVR